MKTQKVELVLEYLVRHGSISRAEAESLFSLNKNGFWSAIRALRKRGYYIVTRKNLEDSKWTRCFLEDEKKRKEDEQKEQFTMSSHHRLWVIWKSMRNRCKNPHHKNFRDYGGRGIKVCDEWRNSFQSFAEWALANGYSDILTIDRIDVNGNYEPSNCRWVDAKTQCRNRRNNRLITFHGKTKTLSEWAEIKRIPVSTLHVRLKHGMSIEDALTTPVRKRVDNCKGAWVAE